MGMAYEEWKGAAGESRIARSLLWTRLFGRKGKVLRNIYIRKEDGTTTEIDVLFLSRKGLFVFESKNYSGRISGYESERYWAVHYRNGQTYDLYNPIWQNSNHIKWLRNLLGKILPRIPMFSIVVFSNDCDLREITVDSPDIKVIHRCSVYWTVRDIWNSVPDRLSKSEVNELYSILKPMTNVSEDIKKAHIENIRTNYREDQGNPVSAVITKKTK